MRRAIWMVFAGLVVIAGLGFAAEERAGEYAAHERELATGLLLKPDGKFAYFFTYGAADYMAEGTWKSEGNTVVLETSGLDAKPFRLVKSGKSAEGSGIRVHVQGQNGQGVEHMDVAVKTASGEAKARTDGQGVAEFPDAGEVKSIALHVPVYEVDGGSFEGVAGATEYWFELNGEAVTRVPFRKERLRVTAEGLELRYWNAERPLVYRKQK